MENENKPNLDKDDEPLVDFDKNVESQGNEPQQHTLDSVCKGSKSSPTPVCNDSNPKSRRLVKKTKPSEESGPVEFELNGDGPDGSPGLVRDDRKGKRVKGEDRRILGKKSKAEKGEKEPRARKKRSGRVSDHDADSDIKEMWDAILGGNFKDDCTGVRSANGNNSIDDGDIDPSYDYGSDGEHSPSQAPQKKGEVASEIEELFRIGKKKNKKRESRPTETAFLVDSVITELNAVADEDAELNRQEKPAITKLRNLSLLTDIIPRKHLQQEFIDRGVLCSLRKWLEPLPDGSIPNIDTRAAVFKCLNDLTIDLGQFEVRQEMKNSGIGKAVMFYYKYDEETTANRKLAKELVDKWSRAIFDISTRYEDMKEDKRTYQAPPVKKATSSTVATASWKHDDLPELSQGQKSGPSSSMQHQHTSRPEAVPMDFAVRPQSKVDPEAVRTQAKRMEQPRARLKKKLQQLSARRKKPLQAVKRSAEGRGMVKYL